MPKKTKPVDSLKITPTGKATFLVELEGWGPLEYRIDDKEVVLEIFKLLIEKMGPTSTVNSYDKRTQKKLQKLLEF